MRLRTLIVSLLSFWFAFGPAMGALAQAADKPCESMAMTLPADDCCGSGMDQAKCLSACVASAPAIPSPAVAQAPIFSSNAAAVAAPIRHASIVAPPDIAPPKPIVS